MNFNQRVYHIVRQIPPGRVATYGTIALLCGNPRASRAVGWAMRQSHGADVPCHRVINRLGQMAPDAVFGGKGLQRAMLEEEGVVFRPNGTVDLSTCAWYGPGE